jgi:hypothetical protein
LHNQEKTSNSTIPPNITENKENLTTISNATLLNLLIEQTELMKTELCKSNNDIVKGLEKLMNNTSSIKNTLKHITSVSVIVKDDIILEFTVCINNMNLIRAELNKMSNLIENIKKANCKELTEVQKRFDEAKTLLNKLVEGIQNFLRKTNLDFNLLILT